MACLFWHSAWVLKGTKKNKRCARKNTHKKIERYHSARKTFQQSYFAFKAYFGRSLCVFLCVSGIGSKSFGLFNWTWLLAIQWKNNDFSIFFVSLLSDFVRFASTLTTKNSTFCFELNLNWITPNQTPYNCNTLQGQHLLASHLSRPSFLQWIVHRNLAGQPNRIYIRSNIINTLNHSIPNHFPFISLFGS